MGPLVALLLLAAALDDKATLRVQTQPAVEVLWEGVSLGRTDGQGILEIEDVPVGTYTVTLQKPGHREDTRLVDLQGGATVLELNLEPSVAPRVAPRSASNESPREAADQPSSLLDASRLDQPGPTDAENAPPGDSGSPDSPIAAPVSRRSFPLLGVAAFAAAAIGVGVALKRRRKALHTAPPTARPRPYAAAWEPAGLVDVLSPPVEKTVAGAGVFLDDLKRREREVGDRGPSPRVDPRRSGVIEVEFRKVTGPDEAP